MTKRCPKCGEERPTSEFNRDRREKDGLYYCCKLCRRAYNAKWRAEHPEEARSYNHKWQRENPEKVRAIKAKYYAKHREEVITRCAKYQAEHPEKRRAYEAKYRAEHPEKVRASQAKYYANHPEKVRSRTAKWARDHPEEVRTRNQVRRTRKAGNGGKYTAAEWKALKAQYDNRCLCCGRQEPEIKLTVDHVIPVALGGTSNIDNIQPLCESCNCRKHTQVMDLRPRS